MKEIKLPDLPEVQLPAECLTSDTEEKALISVNIIIKACKSIADNVPILEHYRDCLIYFIKERKGGDAK